MIKSIEQALAIESILATESPESLEPRIGLATAYATLGRLFGAQPGEFLQAITAYHQAIELHDVIIQEHPELVDQSYQLALELSDLSGLQQKIGQSESAVEYLRRALQIFERIDGSYPHVALYRKGLGMTYNIMSDLEASVVRRQRLSRLPKRHGRSSSV